MKTPVVLVAADDAALRRHVHTLLEAIFINFMNTPSKTVAFGDLPEPFRRQLSEADHSPHSERERVLSALLRTNWNMSHAAQQLRWSRMTLYRKLRKYQIVKSPVPSLVAASPPPARSAIAEDRPGITVA